MNNKQLMSPKSLEIYEKAIEALKAIRKEHKRLIERAKKKTITEEEKKELRELIKAHNKIEKLRKSIWDNHSLVQLILKK